MELNKQLDSVRRFCDKRARFGREGAVRDPSDKRGLKNYFIECALRQAFDAEVQLEGNETVLDLGCGTGLFTETIASQAKLTVGLDVSREMLALAIAHALFVFAKVGL